MQISIILKKNCRGLLYWSISKFKLDFAKILLQKGSDPNHTTKLNKTCLSKAAWNGTADILKRLLNTPGINIDFPDSRKRTPLHNACWSTAYTRISNKRALYDLDSPACVRLLIEAGSDIEAQNTTGNTPICIACNSNATEALKILIKHGANMYHESEDGRPPLHQALARGNLECVKILVENGVDPNMKSKMGWSGLQVAIKYRRIESIDYLLSLNIECGQKDLELTAEFGDERICEKLINYCGK